MLFLKDSEKRKIWFDHTGFNAFPGEGLLGFSLSNRMNSSSIW